MITREELLEGIEDLTYSSYFYSGVLAAISLMPDDKRDEWLDGVAKKLRNLQYIENLDNSLRKMMKKACPKAFEDER